MIGLPPSTRIFVALEPADMRKSFEGLGGIVRGHLDADPLSGHLFLFSNKRRTRLKILYWDGSGLWVMAKRLDKGTFNWPSVSSDQSALRVPTEEMAALIGGLDLLAAKRRSWFRKEPQQA